MTLIPNIPNKFNYIIYTDGACIGNPGPGGWGAIIFKGQDKKILSGSNKHTTNNRMELTASIKALQISSRQRKQLIYSRIANI